MTASGLKRGKALLTGLVLALASFAAAAEPVQIKPGLLRLNGNLELPAGQQIADSRMVLIVHGTLSWYGQETIAALQKNLKQRGDPSLAINLSLGIDDRQRARPCDVLHDYALAGARREIVQWIDWLYSQNARSVDVVGFSRGGAQVAALGPELPKARRLVLLAPTFATAAEQSATYERAFGRPLAPELDKARREPLQSFTTDFLTCRQAPVLGATLLDGYEEMSPRLAAKTGHQTLVVIAGKDEIVPDLGRKLPSEVPQATVEGAGHFFLDLYGEEAADIVSKFLKRDPPAAK